jgi:hypothetical protein
MSLNRLFQALAQQQPAAAPLPAPQNLLKTATAPAPFQSSSAPWQQQLAGAIDFGNSSGDAWNTIGKDGVINYMGDELQQNYGTRNLSDFRYIEDASVPGGYRLDWQGRKPATGFLSGIKDATRSFGVTTSGVAGDGSDGGLTPMNPTDALSFGATWEGKGGTGFNFYRKPDGSVGIKTGGLQSNDKGDIISALAVLGAAFGAQALTGASGAAGGAAAGAAEGAAAAGAGSAGTAGAVGSGAGFIGEGALSGIGAWDATLAASPSWTAAGGMAGGAAAGASGGGGGGAATTGGGFVGEGAASGIPAWDGAAGSGVAGGAGSVGGLGGGGSGGAAPTGTPPPANPYNPASYLDATNLKNLAGSAMSNFSWTDLIGPGLQLIGGAMNADAAKDASDAQLQAAREAAARFEPWRQAGAWGVGRAATMLGKEGPEAAKAAFAVDPGYQWRLSQGENALERAASARGLLGSGRYLKDAMRFNQGEASQEFGNAYNRLTNLAGLGQTATQSSADYLTQGANAQAAGRVGQANAWNNALGQGYGMYQNNRLMSGLGY